MQHTLNVDWNMLKQQREQTKKYFENTLFQNFIYYRKVEWFIG